uniref:Uncharacterized protein n=1 Tax=Anguilla anguilla TaxID=7936 RepID=A0A0E9TKD7_ANGAN
MFPYHTSSNLSILTKSLVGQQLFQSRLSSSHVPVVPFST